MISICIPIYNFDVNDLINALHMQRQKLDSPAEIIAIDDYSEKKYKDINAPITNKIKYIQLDKNIGRSAIRNLFVDYARFDFLLFLDCDSKIENLEFIQKYISIIEEDMPDVVCGGRKYSGSYVSKEKKLRWKYGIKREQTNSLERTINPYSSFMTNNFLIRKAVLNRIKFDERLLDYGHEDTLFGLELKKNNIDIKHVDNEVINGDIEDNRYYIFKTNKAVRNLAYIYKNYNNKEFLINNVSLLNIYNKIKPFSFVITYFYHLTEKPIKYLLSEGIASLFLFDIYRLGLFIKEIKKIKK